VFIYFYFFVLKNNPKKEKDFKTMKFLFKNIFLQKICQVMKIRFKKEKEIQVANLIEN
jgi:hypothetical protein